MTRPYRVGRGQPPKDTQFQKGRSGNPSGRPTKQATASPTSAVARKKMIALSQQPTRTVFGGKEEIREVWDAANAAHLQMGFKGGHRALSQIRREMAQAAAEEEQERSDQYQFWRKWKRDHDGAKLYCTDHPDRKLPWPHPVDIRIDAIAGRVSFCGPLDGDELPLYRAVVEVAELYLIEAEITARAHGSAHPLVRYLRHLAFDAYRSAAPSLGGPLTDQERPALLHRLTSLALDTRAMVVTELRAKRADLFSKFCAALATVDRSVPHWPPVRLAVPAHKPKAKGPKKRHRLCSIGQNDDLRRQIHALLGDGQGVNAVIQSIARSRTSQSVVARYCRLYKRVLQSWTADGELPSKDQPTSLREFKRTFAQFQSYLSERDIGEKERLRRHELPLKPEPTRKGGVSPERINFIKSEILGLEVDPPAEIMD